MKSSLFKKFQILFAWFLSLFWLTPEKKKEQEEKNLNLFGEAKKLEILIAVVRLKRNGVENPVLVDIHEELKNTGRYMHATNILKYLAILIEAGFVERAGHQKFVLSDSYLKSIGL